MMVAMPSSFSTFILCLFFALSTTSATVRNGRPPEDVALEQRDSRGSPRWLVKRLPKASPTFVTTTIVSKHTSIQVHTSSTVATVVVITSTHQETQTQTITTNNSVILTSFRTSFQTLTETLKPTPPATSSAAEAHHHSGGLSTADKGAIGGVVGGVALALISGILFCLYKRRDNSDDTDETPVNNFPNGGAAILNTARITGGGKPIQQEQSVRQLQPKQKQTTHASNPYNQPLHAGPPWSADSVNVPPYTEGRMSTSGPDGTHGERDGTVSPVSFSSYTQRDQFNNSEQVRNSAQPLTNETMRVPRRPVRMPVRETEEDEEWEQY